MMPPLTPDMQQAAGRLEVSISYASEDRKLAILLRTALSDYLDSDFANVWIDVEGIRPGFNLNDQIRSRLDQTDVLIVVYTGQQKESHGFTGLEIGYFLGLKNDNNRLVARRTIVFYLKEQPSTTAGLVGVSFGLDDAQLRLSCEEFTNSPVDTNAIQNVLRDLERDVNTFRTAIGRTAHPEDEAKRQKACQHLLWGVFTILKQRKETDINPQKKLIFKIKDDVSTLSNEIPPSSTMTPEGTGVMAIFGLPERQITWNEFLNCIPDKFKIVWKDTLERLILSSLDKLDVDNSQLLTTEIYHAEVKIFRLILSRRIKYFDGCREFHIYLVDVLSRQDFGDDHTTDILRALGLCCRFRFMFFENRSEFSKFNISTKDGNELRDTARRLIRELNLIKRDSTEAKLDDARVWADLLNNWPSVAQMKTNYDPWEKQVRNAAATILASKQDTELNKGKTQLVELVGKLEQNFLHENAQLIDDLAHLLIAYVVPWKKKPASNTDSAVIPAAPPDAQNPAQQSESRNENRSA